MAAAAQLTDVKAAGGVRKNPGFLPKSLFDRYTIRDKTEGQNLQTNIQTLAGAKHAVKKFAKKHPCSALAIVSDKFGEVESYKPGNGRELVIDRDNSRDYKRKATEEAKKNVRYELYIGGVLHDTYDTRKEAESFARDRRVTDGKNTRIKEVQGNPSCRNPYRIQPAGRKWEVSALNPRGGWDVHATVHTRAEAEKIMGQLRDASPDFQGGVRKVIPGYRGNPAGARRYQVEYKPGGARAKWTPLGKIFTSRQEADAALKKYERTPPYSMTSLRIASAASNPLTKFRVTYRGKSFEVLAATRADAERQVRAVWGGEAAVNPKLKKNGFEERQDFNWEGPLPRIGEVFIDSWGDYWVVTKIYPRQPGRGSASQKIEARPAKTSEIEASKKRRRNPDDGLQKRIGDFTVYAEQHGQTWSVVVSGGAGRKTLAANFPTEKSAEEYVRKVSSRDLNRRRNPDDDTAAAEALYESFHGVPSTGETVYEEVHEVPDAFAELGDLIELKVATIHGKDITIAAPDPDGGDLSSIVKLASSPDGRQLYFIGGDQDIDLEKIGFTESEERHRMLIGVLYELTYRTKKAFHKLKTTDYYHQLGEDTKNQPMLVYNPYSERMGVVGGDYHVRPEGIVN